ncbi:MAG: hypothetical protein ACK50A_01050 [Sphingobacteriaceae bacterium]|jgi:hypothetical protein
MLRKDYILRQFEEFGKVMAIIFGFKHKNEWGKFEEEIEKAVKQFTSLELKELMLLSDAQFKQLIESSTHLNADQIKILADLTYERSIAEMKKEDLVKQNDLLQKSLFLYKRYNDQLTANDFNLEVHYRIALIAKMLNLPNQQ